MYPELLKIGPLSIKSFGVMLLLGFGVAIYWMAREKEKEGIKRELIFDFGLAAIITSLIGARLIFVLLNLEEYFSDPLSIFLPRGGGLGGFSLHGGILGGALFVLFFAQKHQIHKGKLLDLCSPSLALGTAIGRIGCFLNGCCYGIPSNLPWAVKFPEVAEKVHPTQLYASFFNLILFFGLLKIKKYRKFDGWLSLVYLIGYSSFRFILEIFRRGATAKIVLFSLTQAQLLSIFIIITAALVIILHKPR